MLKLSPDSRPPVLSIGACFFGLLANAAALATALTAKRVLPKREHLALMIGAAHGMDTSTYTIPYVSGWAGTVKDKSPAEVVQATGERVRKTAGAILDALPTRPGRGRRPAQPVP